MSKIGHYFGKTKEMGLVEMEATTIKGMISDGVKFNFI